MSISADKFWTLRDEFNLTRCMFQRGSVDWDPLDPNFKYYNPKKYSRWKPTSEESYEFTACKEFLQESSDYEWREKVEQRGRAAPGGDFYRVFELISMS